MAIDVDNVYPSALELIPESFRHSFPHSLVEAMIERYKEHGDKYMLDKTFDGRPMNAIVECDNLTSLWEEVVDSVYNWLGWAFVEGNGKIDISKIQEDYPYMHEALKLLVDVYVSVSLFRTLRGTDLMIKRGF